MAHIRKREIGGRFHPAAGPGLTTDQGKDISRMVGKPMVVGEDPAETFAWKIALLSQRVVELSKPAPLNPYQSDFYKFLSELVYTMDEAAGGRVEKAPDWPFLKELSDHLITCERLFIEKSRRVFASWAVCAFDVWVAAGGQDPRWPALMNATGHRQVFIVSRKYEDSCKFLKRRVKFIVDQFQERGFHEFWPDFPDWEWKENEGAASNGSLITAVAQGSDQLRGSGSTVVHIEEFSFFEMARATVESLLPTIQGGGHCCIVTTPNSSSYARDIRDGILKSGRK